MRESMLEGEAATVFLPGGEGEKSNWQYSKRRMTNFKGNSRVILPRKSKKFNEEAVIETFRMEMMHAFKEYVMKEVVTKALLGCHRILLWVLGLNTLYSL